MSANVPPTQNGAPPRPWDATRVSMVRNGTDTNTDHVTVAVILDAPMMEEAVLNYHPLRNDATTSLSSADLVAFIRATGHEPLDQAVSEPQVQSLR